MLKVLCKVEWPALGVGWPPEGSLDKTMVNEVCGVIVGKPGHPEQFPFINCWQDAVLSQAMWLRPYLEEAYKIMVARVAAASKCREKTRVCTGQGATLPTSATSTQSHTSPPTLDGESRGTVTLVKSGLEA
jgi:hypothetical protein